MENNNLFETESASAPPTTVTGQRNRKLLFIGGIAGLIVVIGFAGAVLATTVRPIRQLLGLYVDPIALDYVPATTPVLITFNPSAAQVINMVKLRDLVAANPALTEKVDEFTQQTDALNFQADVASWIGVEMAVAVIDSPNSFVKAPEVVVMATIRDRSQLNAAIDRVQKTLEAKGFEFIEQKYKNTTITLIKPLISPVQCCVSYAIYEDNLLLATIPDAIETMIDTREGRTPAMKSNPEYQKITQNLPASRSATLFADVTKFTDELRTSTSPGVLALDGAKSLGLAISFETDGVEVSYASSVQSASLTAPRKKYIAAQKTDPNGVLSRVPADALLVISGQDLKSLWTYFNDVLANDMPQVKVIPFTIAQIRLLTGVDIENDLVAWMTGEYAIAVVPARPSVLFGENLRAGLLLLFDVNATKDTSQEGLSRVVRSLRHQNIIFRTKQINGVDAQVLADGEIAGVTPGYAFADGYFYIASSEDVLTTALAASQSPLSQDSDFKKVISALPNDNTGILYVAVPRVISVFGQVLPPLDISGINTDVPVLVHSWKGIGFASGLPTLDGTQHASLFIYITK